VKAVVCDRYGSPDVLRVEDVEKPELENDRVLVRVRAAAINPADWYGFAGPLVLRPMTGLRKPKQRLLGVDLAGTVEAVGKDVTELKPGDDVFGGRSGALAEYVCTAMVVPKPANLSFEEAAGVGVAGLTALQGLRDKAHLEAGQRVLINGASGGVGTFAVQIAKAFGAEVTAVCSTGKVDLAGSLGADRVIDYTREDFTRSRERYDVLFDVAGNRTWSECLRVLEPDGTFVMVGAPKGGPLGPLGPLARKRLASWLRGSQKAVFYIAKFNKPDLHILRELLESGKVTPVVDRTFELSEAADAFRYLGEGHASGKIVVRIS
jgi:NADPH:quinone reductase-like Zn-dependent oxidoreductase